MSIEVVNNFNNELKMLLETKLPVSRQRMYQITKAAMKASKYYKHVVQSVEKVIFKCPDEYKLPGLYVVDSIVRHSRHHHGDKDMFGPRFTKNLVSLFRDVLKSQQTDISLVVRLLNLWQKNTVFDSELIQSLLDIAANPHNEEYIQTAADIATRISSDYVNKRTSLQRRSSKETFGQDSQNWKPENDVNLHSSSNHLPHSSDMKGLYNNQMQLPNLENEHEMYLSSSNDIKNEYNSESPLKNESSDDAYGIDIGQALIGSVTELLHNFQSGSLDSDTQIMQLQILQEKIVEHSDMLANGQIINPEVLGQLHLLMSELTNRASSMEEADPTTLNDEVDEVRQFGDPYHQSEFIESDQSHPDEKLPSQPNYSEYENGEDSNLVKPAESLEEGELDPDLHASLSNDMPFIEDQEASVSADYPPSSLTINDSRQELNKKRKRSCSSSRSPRKKRSRSRERKKDRHKEMRKERRKKGYPPPREGCVSLLSRTIFIGHLAKQTTEKRLRSELEHYGPIEFFNLIPPRGCAFVTFEHRKAAAKAIDDMEGMRLDYKEIKVTWAMNKGVKDSKFSSLFDLVTGCTYIPEEKMPLQKTARTSLLDGGGELDLDSFSSRTLSRLEKLMEEEKRDEEYKLLVSPTTDKESFQPSFSGVSLVQPPPPPLNAPILPVVPGPFIPMIPPPPPQPGLIPPCIPPPPSMPIPMPPLINNPIYQSQVSHAPFAPPPPPPPTLDVTCYPPQPPATSSDSITNIDIIQANSSLDKNTNGDDTPEAADHSDIDSTENQNETAQSITADYERNQDDEWNSSHTIDPTLQLVPPFRPRPPFRTPCPSHFNLSPRMRQPLMHRIGPNRPPRPRDFRPSFAMRPGPRPLRPGFMIPRWGGLRPHRPRPF